MKYSNILLIDDDTDDQDFFSDALKIVSETVAFTATVSGLEALDMMGSKKISPEVIFLDWNMPIMDGQQFLQEIKKIDGLKDIPVIILSTSSSYKTIALSRELGAKDFITKPNNFGELVEILTSFVKR